MREYPENPFDPDYLSANRSYFGTPYFSANGQAYFPLCCFKQGEEFTITFNDEILEGPDSDGNYEIRYDIIYQNKTFTEESNFDGFGQFVMATDWEGQKQQMEEEIEARMEREAEALERQQEAMALRMEKEAETLARMQEKMDQLFAGIGLEWLVGRKTGDQ